MIKHVLLFHNNISFFFYQSVLNESLMVLFFPFLLMPDNHHLSCRSLIVHEVCFSDHDIKQSDIYICFNNMLSPIPLVPFTTLEQHDPNPPPGGCLHHFPPSISRLVFSQSICSDDKTLLRSIDQQNICPPTPV